MQDMKLEDKQLKSSNRDYIIIADRRRGSAAEHQCARQRCDSRRVGTAFSRPAISCLAFSCPAILSAVFMSCNFVPCNLVRQIHVLQFHVRHFQRPATISHRFRDKWRFQSKIAEFSHPLYLRPADEVPYRSWISALRVNKLE